MTKTYYHVGCGKAFEVPTDGEIETLAIACSCGAYAPILVPDLSSDVTDIIPASLLRLLSPDNLRNLPHLEYYLGFSDFSCPAKEEWVKILRNIGLISFSECDDEQECRDYYWRMQRLL